MKNLTPIRVASGSTSQLSGTVDNPIIRLNEIPYIPGSSLKGSFRSILEARAKSMGIEICNVFETEKERIEEHKKNPCVICGIFGSKFLASHIRIYDMYPDGEIHVFTRTGIGINRIFGSSQPGVLYKNDFIIPGVKWRFEMDIININLDSNNDDRAKLLKILFKELKDIGIQIGSRKSIGLGLIKLIDAKIKVYTLSDGDLKLNKEYSVGEL